MSILGASPAAGSSVIRGALSIEYDGIIADTSQPEILNVTGVGFSVIGDRTSPTRQLS